METAFHTLLDRAVLHTHAVYVNAITCLSGGRALANRLFGEAVCWVAYEAPGLTLARAVENACRHYRSEHDRHPQAVFLENHGLIAAVGKHLDLRILPMGTFRA